MVFWASYRWTFRDPEFGAAVVAVATAHSYENVQKKQGWLRRSKSC